MAKKGAARADALAALEERISWRFSDRALLEEAVRHGSVLDQRPDLASYERLEFLGDRVLNLIVTEHLFHDAPDAQEGELAVRLNKLINRTACAEAARRADLGAALTLSKSEDLNGGRNKETILADACEALIAALYLDGGMDPARAFVLRFWGLADNNRAPPAQQHAKSALQEWAAADDREVRYELVERTGPDHAPRFVVDAHVGEKLQARGEGPTKREAERAAAEALLDAVRRSKADADG